MGKSLYLVDTCSFVQQFSDPNCSEWIDGLILKGQFVLSAVVAMELYAGTKDQQSKRALDTLAAKLNEAGLVVTPDYGDYQKAGLILKNYSRRKGALGSSTHFRDILICLGAIQCQAAVVTENGRDFLRWASEITRNFNRRLDIYSWRELI